MADKTMEIEYPPFCELCIKKFATNRNAFMHFDGPKHRNKVMLMMQRRKEQELLICETCCVEITTERELEIHKLSPKHLKNERDLVEILELKSKYDEQRQANATSSTSNST